MGIKLFGRLIYVEPYKRVFFRLKGHNHTYSIRSKNKKDVDFERVD